jgi:hypothetical protein
MNKVTKLAVEFIENHWEEIDLKKVGISSHSKQSFLAEIVTNYYSAGWVLNEVMSWGLDIDYIKEYQVETEGAFLVLLIDNSYFRFDCKTHLFVEVEPKFKTIMYF